MMQPGRIQYVETYEVACPHGCYAGASITITRDKGGPVSAINIRCNGVHVKDDVRQLPHTSASERVMSDRTT